MKITRLILIILSVIAMDAKLCAQSFIMRYDLDQNSIPNFVAAAPDGGYVISQNLDYSSPGNVYIEIPYVLKTDSLGVPQWYNQYPINPATTTKGSRKIIPLTGGDFVFFPLQRDDMFDTYDQSMLYKLDSMGTPFAAKKSNWGPFATSGFSINPKKINYNTNIITSLVRTYSYNGTNGPCCYNFYLLQSDDNLNFTTTIKIDDPTTNYQTFSSVEEIYTNNNLTGFLVGSEISQMARIMSMDTAGVIQWYKGYDYTHIVKIIQDGNSFLILGKNSVNNVFFDSYLHKVDLAGNTIFFKVITAADPIILTDIVRKDSTYLISGLSRLITNPFTYSGIILKTDLAGNVMQAYKSSDSLYTYAGIDQFGMDFMFLKKTSSQSTSSFAFERIQLDDMGCGYNPYAVFSTDTLVTDTLLSATTTPLSAFSFTPDAMPYTVDTLANLPYCGPLCQDVLINITATGCGSYESPSGNYVWTTSGIYTDTVPRGFCDSIFTVNLTILPAAFTTISGDSAACAGSIVSLSATPGYSNYIWSTGATTTSIAATISGVYTVTVTNTFGCTADTSFELIIHPQPTTIIMAQGPVSFCAGDSVKLVATPGMSTWQWYRYNSPISGATANNYTAKLQGRHYCIGTDANQCADTSNKIHIVIPCIQLGPSIERLLATDIMTVYPNPANDLLHISIPVIIEVSSLVIYNITGTKVFSDINYLGDITLDVSGLQAGMYLLEVQQGEHWLRKKFVIE